MKKSKVNNKVDFAPVLVAASRALVVAMMAKISNSGFSDMTPAFVNLIPLLDTTGVRATTLAQQSGITKQAISQLIRELESRGYVEQVTDLTDTRAKMVRLTKRGVALNAACAELRQGLQSAVIAKLGKLKVSRLQRDLIELAAVLEEMRTR